MRKLSVAHSTPGTDDPRRLLPGTLIAVGVTAVSFLLAELFGAGLTRWFDLDYSPVSTFLIAIVLGMIVKNAIPLPAGVEPGFRFCVSRVLRAGIILLGIRLSLVALLRIGAVAALIVVICVAAAIVVTGLLSRRFGVSDRLGTLIAAGTSICGVSAVVAVSPAIGAREEETSYAISTVTIFGVLATLLYPYLAEPVLGLSTAQAGLFLGTAVHDTSQVTGAAFIYDQVWARNASGIAVTTKLVRNTLMVLVIPLLSIAHARRTDAAATSRPSLWSVFPVFVLGFVALALLRTLGDAMLAGDSGAFLWWTTSESWAGFHGGVAQAAAYLLSLAIAAAGLSTDFRELRRLSLRPFLIGFVAAAVVGLVSYLLVTVSATAIAVHVPV
ncbi:MAG: YeiH family protein [Spirochaetaceae bacterium]